MQDATETATDGIQLATQEELDQLKPQTGELTPVESARLAVQQRTAAEAHTKLMIADLLERRAKSIRQMDDALAVLGYKKARKPRTTKVPAPAVATTDAPTPEAPKPSKKRTKAA